LYLKIPVEETRISVHSFHMLVINPPTSPFHTFQTILCRLLSPFPGNFIIQFQPVLKKMQNPQKTA